MKIAKFLKTCPTTKFLEPRYPTQSKISPKTNKFFDFEKGVSNWLHIPTRYSLASDSGKYQKRKNKEKNSILAPRVPN